MNNENILNTNFLNSNNYFIDKQTFVNSFQYPIHSIVILIVISEIFFI